MFSAVELFEHGSLEGPTIGEFKPVPATLDDYNLASDLTGVFREPPSGLVIHYAGLLGDQLLSGSLWAARHNALDFFAAHAGPGLTELIGRLAEPGRDTDISYQMMPVHASVIGPSAADFNLRPRGEAGAATLVRTPGGSLPSESAEGLIVAAQLGAEDRNLLYEIYDHRPANVAGDAELIALHVAFVTAGGVEQLVGQ